MTQLKFSSSSAQRPLRSVRATRLFAVGKPTGSKGILKELVKIVEDTNRGLDVTSVQKERIGDYVMKLQELGEGQTTTGDQMSATWKMLWTTEKARFTNSSLRHFWTI
eukprot:g6563.t1